jgi:hypothetical protein
VPIGEANRGGLGKVAIAGIVAGAVVLTFLIYLLWFCRRAKTRARIRAEQEKDKTTTASATNGNGDQSGITSSKDGASPVEADTNAVVEADGNELPPPAELDAAKEFSELPDATGTLAGFFKEVELDSSAEHLFEMEGSPVSPTLLASANPTPGSSSNPGSSSTPASSSRVTPMSRTSGTPPSTRGINETIASGVSSLGSMQDTLPPLPRIPIEARSSRGVRDRLNGIEVPPASPIPQTPLEFYGGQVPEWRWRDAQIRNVEHRLQQSANRLLVPQARSAEIEEFSAPPPAYEEKDKSLFEEADQNSQPEQQFPDKKRDKGKQPEVQKILEPRTKPNIRVDTGNPQVTHLGVLPSPSPAVLASPIPKTPAEYYGKRAAIPSSQLRDEEGADAVGVSKEENAPTMIVSPVSPTAPEDSPTSPEPLQESSQKNTKPQSDHKDTGEKDK